jgi:hypothetical protein
MLISVAFELREQKLSGSIPSALYPLPWSLAAVNFSFLHIIVKI